MIAYEFYWAHSGKGYELLGVLPERRKNSQRITEKSVMNWADRVLGNNLSAEDIYFVRVTIDKYTGKLFRTPFFVTQERG